MTASSLSNLFQGPSCVCFERKCVLGIGSRKWSTTQQDRCGLRLDFVFISIVFSRQEEFTYKCNFLASLENLRCGQAKASFSMDNQELMGS